ncbi:MAG: glycosyltransferase [Acidobacteria bacterium]|nr:glycosyltransferase [Acidobacteriota bacterium]
MSAPRFSILVPTYNQSGYLPECLESLRAQTFDDWEAVVVDDGSTDGTRAVLADFAARDPRILPFHKPNGGVATALNAALGEARGEWVGWLSSDDLYEPDALQVFAAAMAAAPEVAFFHSDFTELVHETGERRPGPPGRAETLPPKGQQTVAFLHGNMIHGISICVRKRLFDRAGAFKQELRYAQDMDMWFRMSALTELRYLDHRTCITRIHTGQGTLGFPEAGLFDSARACLDFLNTHPFEALFPHLDLTTGDGITEALQSALGAALNLNAAMYAGVGPEPALLERLGEWLLTGCPVVYRDSLVAGLQALEAQLGAAPASLRNAVGAMARREARPYHPRDARALMAARRAAAATAGDAHSAGLLDRYLRLGSPTPAPEAPVALREAFLLEPDFGGEAWAELLLGYLTAFRAGDPVGLILLLDPTLEGAPSSDEVGAAVVDLAQRMGLEAFPDVLLVDEADQLLPHLRAFHRIHRLPFPGARPGTETPASLRLARRLAS